VIAVLRRGLLDQRRSVVLWGLSLGALGALMAGIYPSIQGSISTIADKYPAGLKEAFGITDLGTVEGYVHAEMFSLIVPLAIAFFGVRSVASAIVGAEEQGRLDTILALPLSRRAFAVGSVLAALLASAGVLAITGLITFAVGRIAGTDISAGLTTAGVLGVWPLAVLGSGLATLGSGALHRTRSVTGMAMAVVVAMYAIDIAGRVDDSLEPLRYASAFRYYGAPMRDGIDVSGFALVLGAGLILAAAGTWFFERRDLG
jgi:ABC-2 type transport system permease protein